MPDVETKFFIGTQERERKWKNPDDQTVNDKVSTLRTKIENVYGKGHPASADTVREIQEELAEIPNLIINFDETLTEDSTIKFILSKIIDHYNAEGKIEEARSLQEKSANFREGLRRKSQDELPDNDPRHQYVKYFYTEVIKGVPRGLLEEVYDKICHELPINRNFKEIIEKLREEGIKKIRLLFLSLNNYDLVKRYYEKNMKERLDIENVGFLGNEVQYENGRVCGVIEHVKDDNKKDFVPHNAVMLADVRESWDLAKEGVNVVNIQGENYDIAIFRSSRMYAMSYHWMEDLENGLQDPFISISLRKGLVRCLEKVKSFRSDHERLVRIREKNLARISKIDNQQDGDTERDDFLEFIREDVGLHLQKALSTAKLIERFISSKRGGTHAR